MFDIGDDMPTTKRTDHMFIPASVLFLIAMIAFLNNPSEDPGLSLSASDLMTMARLVVGLIAFLGAWALSTAAISAALDINPFLAALAIPFVFYGIYAEIKERRSAGK